MLAFQNLGDQNTFDFGSIHFAPGKCATKVIEITNSSDELVTIAFRFPVAPDQILRLNILPAEDCAHMSESNLFMLTDMIPYDIEIEPKSVRKLVMILSFMELESYQQKTSYDNVTYAFVMTEKKKKYVSEYEYNLSFLLCSSVMNVDDTEIEFDACMVGNTYVRDVQVWNRSECTLFFKISPASDVSTCPFYCTDFESSQTIGFYQKIFVPAFASKRFRIVFKAKVFLYIYIYT